MVKKGELIVLENGQNATVVVDPKKYNHIYVVELENHDVRVVDKKSLALMLSLPHGFDLK
ncbi:bacteriocin [Lactococcus hircilactis]|uniref:Bacteriocin n=1 Tax=Lactococcus hircilactis TaxID=1494462 RepID=A0A7X2D0P0_9LACT|nr:bacteriocin [Lactococcus hircilactis]MQW39666.1 bacteriocin [Lactococcus hircilactis]